MFEVKSYMEILSPIHPAHLSYLERNGLDVTRDVLDSIERHFPRAIEDRSFRAYRTLSDAGSLHRKRGRKRNSISRGMLWFIFFAIEEEKARIWADRRSGAVARLRGDPSPGAEAAQRVADRLRLNCTGEALLNRLAKERIPKNI